MKRNYKKTTLFLSLFISVSSIGLILTLLYTLKKDHQPSSRITTSTMSFEGTGRTCYGNLIIKPKNLSWKTPFSSCLDTPYSIENHTISNGNVESTTYILQGKDPNCLFRKITLTHNNKEDMLLGWNVTGYTDPHTEVQQPNQSQSCYLIKNN